ncbi:hypothetical protein Tco_0031050 [Tanacetum coccineum]
MSAHALLQTWRGAKKSLSTQCSVDAQSVRHDTAMLPSWLGKQKWPRGSSNEGFQAKSYQVIQKRDHSKGSQANRFNDQDSNLQRFK